MASSPLVDGRWWPRGRAGLALAVLLFVSLVGRAGWMLHARSVDADATRYPDTLSYERPALALERDGRFAVRPGNGSPEFFRTPGYPAFIAAVFLVAGEHEEAVLVAQIVLSVVAIWLGFVVAGRIWGEAAGMVAAVLLALDPLQIWASGTLLSESLNGVLLLAAVAVAFRVFSRRASTRAWAGALGLTLALATLVRPTTYYFLIIVALALAVAAIRGRSAHRLAVAGLLLAPIVFLVGGWQLRNHFEVRSWRLAGVESFNLYAYRGAGALAEDEGLDFESVQARLLRQVGPDADDHELYDRGVQLVLQHPWGAVVGALNGLGREVAESGRGVVPKFFLLNFTGPGGLVLEAWLVGFWAAAIYGAARALRHDRRRRSGHVFALGLAAYVLLVSAGPDASYRFRVPIVPILAVYAAGGCVAATGALRNRRVVARGARRNQRTVGPSEWSSRS